MILGHQMSTSNIVQLKALLSLATSLSYSPSFLSPPPHPTHFKTVLRLLCHNLRTKGVQTDFKEGSHSIFGINLTVFLSRLCLELIVKL